jgi:hypothetical protein
MSCEDASSVHKESPNPAAAGELASDSHLHYLPHERERVGPVSASSLRYIQLTSQAGAAHINEQGRTKGCAPRTAWHPP